MLHTFDALDARLDALKRKCNTGYGCGSACINVKKECRSEGGAPSKERIQRLQQLAAGEIKPKGLGVPKVAEAAAMATSLQKQRTTRAQELVFQRQAARQAKAAEQKPAKPYRPTPQIKQGVSVKPMSIAAGGDTAFEPSAEKKQAAGGLKYYRSRWGGSTKQNYFFRDRQAAQHWYADHNAKSDADAEATNRRGSEWQAEYKASYVANRNLLRDLGDRELLETIEAYAAAGTATSRGTATDVRIGGNKHSRPIREGTFGVTPQPAQPAEQVLTNPGREDPGLAPKPKQQGLNAQDVTTSSQQAAFARQQRQAAVAAGDQKAAAAWQQEERTVERQRLQGAINRNQQSQSSLFGVTEYDETMPLFNRRDSVDPVAQLVGQILAEQLPGAQVLDWSRQPRGITAGRAVSEGLVYRFRCDSDSIGYRPAWEGIDERQWELRSEGFLLARDPDARMDFKGPKFRQQQTRRRCSKGYGCGSACIAMGKECRVNPSSAISKVRLKQLQALAQEGDAKAAAQAQELQLQRDAKAQGLQQGRQTAKLQELLKNPRIAEMVRTGKVPTAEVGNGPAAAPKPGDVRNIKPDEVEVDPERFQYKLAASKTGEVGSLSGVQRWDPNLAGVVSVWQDPADGKTYVINGHNRLALAKRLGAEEVTVRYLKAGSAKEARAIGAMQNIAEGAGSEVDAGKFFRDTGITSMEQAQARGLPLRSGKTEKGLALAQLPDEMFQDVVQGNLRMRRAAVIGASGLDQDKQREVYKVLKARPSMTDETLQEYVEHLAVSSRQSQTEMSLFGTETKTVDTGLARAELSNGLKKALSREARLLGAVSKNSQAVELLERKGGNTINVEQSQQQAQEANSVLRVFNQLKSSGQVGAALDQAAARVTAGESKSKVQKELREAVIQAMEDELKQLGLRKEEPKNEAPTMSMFDAADRFDALAARLMVAAERMDRRCQRPDGTFYGTSGQCRKGKKAGASATAGKKSPTTKTTQPVAAARAKVGGPVGPAGQSAAAPRASTKRIKTFVSDNGPKGAAARSYLENVTTSFTDDKKKRLAEFQQRHGLTALEMGALVHYSGDGYISMNIMMRGRKPPEKAYKGVGGKSRGPAIANEAIVAMESAFRKLPEHTGEVRRGLKIARENVRDFFVVGQEYADPSFQSTAQSGSNAADTYGTLFGHRAVEYSQAVSGGKRHMNAVNTMGVTLIMSGDHGGRVLGSGSDKPDEQEVLIPRGQRFKVKKTQAGVNHMFVWLEAIPAERADSLFAPFDPDRFDALAARIDALKRKCVTGYGCGSACISPAKECRSEGGKASTGKERLRRLQQLAQGAAAGRGIGQLRGEAAAAKAQQIQQARNQQAQQLRTSRAIAQQHARDKAASAIAKGRQALKPSPSQEEDNGPRPAPPAGGSASNPKLAFEAATTELGRGMFGSVRMAQDGLVVKRGVITQAEIRVLKRLEDSPITPRLHAVQTMEGPTGYGKGKRGFVVMDLAPGETLKAWIHGPERSPEEMREVFSNMLRIRKTLHTTGVAHNDMHAGNIFWDSTAKRMTVVDFGESRIDPTAALIEALGTGRGLIRFNKVEAPGDYQSRSTIQALNRGRAQTGNPEWKRFQANRRRVEALLKAEGAGELISRSIRSVPRNNSLTKQRAAELIQMLYEGL